MLCDSTQASAHYHEPSLNLQHVFVISFVSAASVSASILKEFALFVITV